jgi:hypothetical protein
MSADKREDILVQIFTIMGTVTGITSNVRNRGLMQNEQRPAQVLLDGDELPRLTINTPTRIRGVAGLMVPQIMELRPQIFLLPKEKRPKNDDPTNIGSEANAWRLQILQKLWQSAELAELLGSNGSIVYNGCETDLKSGSAMSGEIRLDFIVNYVLRPTA